MKLWVKFLILFVVFAAVVAGLAFFKTKQIQAAMAMGAASAPGPPTVSTVEVQKEKWENRIRAVGTLVANEGITLAAEIDGLVSDIHFDSGDEVTKGDLLLVQDHSVETANLEAAKAQSQLARLNFSRSKDLLDRNTISEADFDAARAQKQRAEANVKSIEALIAKKRIEAPFSGTLGIRRANLGQLLSPGDPIAVLEASDPLYLDFNLPQRNLGKLKVGQKVSFEVDGYEGKKFTGTVQAISPRVSQQTRNVEVRVSVPNPGRVLRSGMFASLELDLGNSEQWVTIPNTAINYNPFGNGVYVVTELENKEDGSTFQGVRQVFIEIVEKRGDLVAVRKGVDPGDEVVVAGITKLRDRSEVNINNDVVPDAKKDPNPPEG